MSFSIEISPSLPSPPLLLPDIPFEEVDVAAIIRASTEEYSIRYWVDNRMFSYYPSSVLTALNDLELEWSLVRKRKSHSMTLSGYPVLDMDFEGDQATLYDSTARIHGRDAEWSGAVFDAKELEHTFRFSVNSLWFLIKKIQRQSAS